MEDGRKVMMCEYHPDSPYRPGKEVYKCVHPQCETGRCLYNPGSFLLACPLCHPEYHPNVPYDVVKATTEVAATAGGGS